MTCPEPKPRLLLADDHQIVTEGLLRLLGQDFDLLPSASNGRELLSMAIDSHPDIIITDISMPDMNGFEVIEKLRRKGIDTPVVILTMHQEPAYVKKAMKLKVNGYVMKHSASEVLIHALKTAMSGESYYAPELDSQSLPKFTVSEVNDHPLSQRQLQVLQHLTKGLSAKQIASELEISTRTVEFHKYTMMDKLKIETSAELIQFAVQEGLVPSTPI